MSRENAIQINMKFSSEEFALLKAYAEAVGKVPTAAAKCLVLDVLRDDAAFHMDAHDEVPAKDIAQDNEGAAA